MKTNKVNTKSYLHNMRFKADKVTDDGEFGYFEGYAITFDNLDRDGDIALKGCFEKTLKNNPNVCMCWQHDIWQLIGSYPTLKEDNTGLFVKGRINLGVEKGREAYALLKAGDLNCMSIGYVPTELGVEFKDGIRYLKEVDLYEISLVSIPANPQAVVTDVKKIDIDSVKSINDRRGFEKALRESGAFSVEACKKLASFATFEPKAVGKQREAVNPLILKKLKEVVTLVKQRNNI